MPFHGFRATWIELWRQSDVSGGVNWFEIDALCKLNSLPFNATGETIRDGGTWRVYEFTWHMDAILFWDHFKGRWLRGSEFHYPKRPADLPKLETAPQPLHRVDRRPKDTRAPTQSHHATATPTADYRRCSGDLSTRNRDFTRFPGRSILE
jgi:hypothetical protein